MTRVKISKIIGFLRIDLFGAGAKRNFIFWLTSFTGLILADLVFAQITLPNPLGNTTSFSALIQNIINYIAGIVGSLAVLVFVWAGILFLTSAGNPGQIEKAKKAVFYAAIGLAIAIAASGLIALITYIITG